METGLAVLQDKFLARKSEVPKWFSDEIVDGLQTLVLIRLKWGPPTKELAAELAAAWCVTCWEMLKDWNQNTHVPYIQRAFRQMRQELTEFPAPVEFKNRIVPHFTVSY